MVKTTKKDALNWAIHMAVTNYALFYLDIDGDKIKHIIKPFTLNDLEIGQSRVKALLPTIEKNNLSCKHLAERFLKLKFNNGALQFEK